MRTIIGLLMTLALGAEAQIYEWFDDEGRRHFSDRKPVGVEYRVVGGDESRLSTYTPEPVPRPGAGEIPEPRGDESRSVGAQGDPGTDVVERACRRYRSELEAIGDRLRAGYDEPEGNRLRARRSALQQAWRRDCT